MDVAIAVTWANGQVTHHTIRDLPDLSAEELDELLEQDLASYLDPDELPFSCEGWALAWVAIQFVSS
jgi:hypothetical protein